VWRQESILGTLFEGRVRRAARGVVPTLSGRAWITAETTLRFAADDPLREGLRP
jgi:4-hydroxyproline epimerase